MPTPEKTREDWKRYFVMVLAFEAGRQGVTVAELAKRLMRDPVVRTMVLSADEAQGIVIPDADSVF